MKRLIDRMIDLSTYERPFVSVRALAAYLDCDPRTIIRMIHEQTLTATKVGREWRIPTNEARKTFHVKIHQQAS